MLSPTSFNVLMNRIAKVDYPSGVRPIIYAGDVLIQSSSVVKMQVTLTQLSRNCVSLELIVDEAKTKYQCRSHINAVLVLNGKQLDRVHAYKYLGMYIDYNKTAKNAELRHIELAYNCNVLCRV